MARMFTIKAKPGLRRFLLGSASLLAGFGLLLAVSAPVDTAPFRDEQGKLVPGSIATMEQLTIGGVSQMIWFRGANVANPALILLHGGPGASESALFRHYNAELERHFLVAYWEQRGTGRSFHTDISSSSMTIEQFVRDLDEVVAIVKARFHKQKVVLLGHSWGTAIGTIYAATHPDNVAAYVGVGQIANMPQGEMESYQFALTNARKTNNGRAIEELERIGVPPHTVDQMLISRKWVERFGGSFHDNLSMGKLLWAAIGTDEASWVDLILFGRGNRFSLHALWPQLAQLELDEQHTTFHVPMFFLLGRYDWQIPAVRAEAYFEQIDAPHKQLIWFEQSAHNVPFEEPALFNQILIEHVLPFAAHSQSAKQRHSVVSRSLPF